MRERCVAQTDELPRDAASNQFANIEESGGHQHKFFFVSYRKELETQRCHGIVSQMSFFCLHEISEISFISAHRSVAVSAFTRTIGSGTQSLMLIQVLTGAKRTFALENDQIDECDTSM